MNYSLEVEQEADGRWLAEVSELPGVLAYGASSEEAMAKAEALALRVLAEQLEHGESRALDIPFPSPLRREQLAFVQGQASIGCPSRYRVARQTAIRFASHFGP